MRACGFVRKADAVVSLPRPPSERCVTTVVRFAQRYDLLGKAFSSDITGDGPPKTGKAAGGRWNRRNSGAAGSAGTARAGGERATLEELPKAVQNVQADGK